MEGHSDGNERHPFSSAASPVGREFVDTVPQKDLSRCCLPSNVCELLVVRHGLTEYNKLHRLQGQLDIPLNDEGREQCRACGREVKRMFANPATGEIDVDVVYSSPLSRTAESTEIICRESGILSSRIRHDPRIMEWNAGILQGYLLSEIQEKFPAEWALWRKKRDPDYIFPGGESLRMRYARVASFFSEIVRNQQGKRVLVVTHGGVLDELFRIIKRVPLTTSTNAPKLNAEVHVVRAELMAEMQSSTRPLLDSTPAENGSFSQGEEARGDCHVQWTIVRWGKVKDPQNIPAGSCSAQVPNAIEYV
ncbi:phosphoglycerate mutase family protein [Besnoitia besnoiti]|uniref:Phosphoglycerate mutase family protein n=1 Tax=Besnoitia besnoiti TaxID=94643 RepID=A0A2A9MHC4_BESBE|nr:phosphoglycerate mutase family protein [Besnoitia besnoiti]PFH37365.1 phosphoglycerate mutase family protein [Besnoitia besnoiti]